MKVECMTAMAAFALVALAGCASTKGDLPLSAEFITPGVWDVRGDPDFMYAWVHNPNAGAADVNWELSLEGGAPLPSNWTVSFQPAGASLYPNGTPAQGQTYPDWAATLITLKLPASWPAGNVSVELHAGNALAKEKLVVHANRGHVAQHGSRMTVQYVGRFQDTGQVFDPGAQPLGVTVDATSLIAGFTNGLKGLGIGESAQLVIPAAFGYGYDNPPGDYAKFNGRTLVFDVKITQLS